MMHADDQACIEGLLSGQERALREFYDRFAPLLKGFVAQRVSHEKDAEEIVQDTLFAFLDRVRDFNGTASLSTYLCAIARNKVIDYYRKKKLKQVVFSQLPQGVVELFTNTRTPDTQLDQVLLRERIAQILSGLRPLHKQLLLLKYRDGLSVVEIASKLSFSFKSAESNLFRARRAFIKAYGK